MGFVRDDKGYDWAAPEMKLANDPELVAAASALDRDFEALGVPMPHREDLSNTNNESPPFGMLAEDQPQDMS